MRVRNKAVELATRGLLSDGAETFLLHNLPLYVPVDPTSDEFRGVIRRNPNDSIKVEWRLDGKIYSLSELALKVINKYREGEPRPSAAGPHHWGTRIESYANWADRLHSNIRKPKTDGPELAIVQDAFKNFGIVQETVKDLDAGHIRALQWFDQHSGINVARPKRKISGIFLTSQQKGIHKPKGWDYALSIRQTIVGKERYPDRGPSYLPDGSWIYEYHKEVGEGDNGLWTNKSLLTAKRDHVPVGILRQQDDGDYQVLGVGIPISYDGDYFRIIGFRPGWIEEAVQSSFNENPSAKKEIEMQDETDRRRRATIELALRRGQGKFRRELDRAYRGRCAISSTNVRAALEAAHILPYRGDHTNQVANGILLRADWHGLFDAGLVYIDEQQLEVRIASELTESIYKEKDGTSLFIPQSETDHPSSTALRTHRSYAERNATFE